MRIRKPPGSPVALDVQRKQILQLLDIRATLIRSRFAWLDANHTPRVCGVQYRSLRRATSFRGDGANHTRDARFRDDLLLDL
jgi:hypothetical protein